jgi:hypothetical protein
MEKIQIQFNESDYTKYHDYCLKYYQVHDTARRQAIHAFLELYTKGILAVEEQDLRPARRFLTEKCNELNVEKDTGAGVGAAVATRARLCTDLLAFLDDLEKMYRLIKKQGIVPNYVMLLATFSNVIEEMRDAAAVGLYDVDRTLIEALATPLAGMIRRRLGTDRQWQSALKELSFIATRFGQKFPEPAFDAEIVQLVAPYVVAHFNRDVGIKEILSALSSCYEECELDEFESLLNRTPEALKYDQEAEIDWDEIAGPLEAVSAEVNRQRERLAREASTLADPALLMALGSGTDDRPAPAVSPPPGKPVLHGGKTFDIAVTADGSTQVESPIKAYPHADEPVKAPDFGALKPYVPLIIGFAIIVLFIVGTMFLSGDWEPFGNSTNVTSTGQKNVTATKTTAKPAATTAKPAATTAKPAATTAKPTATPTPKVYSASDIGNHLLDIAFGTDNSKLEKPNKTLVSLSVSGTYSDSDIDHLKKFINEFNIYSATTKLSTNLNLEGRGDIPIMFMPEDSLLQVDQNSRTDEFRDTDTGRYYLITTSDRVYVNSDLSGAARKKWLVRSALTKMGCLGETYKYSDSIFYTNTNTAVEPNSIDWKAIQMMFGKKVTIGMTKAQVKTVLGL